MPNRNTHAIIGAISSGLTYAVECNRKNQNPKPEEMLQAAAGGAITGIVPDVLEPATNPNHREFFHSILFGAGVGKGAQKAEKLNLTEKQKIMLKSLSAGYLSHLAADATTPKGLPVAD